jgi:hypothetical protein
VGFNSLVRILNVSRHKQESGTDMVGDSALVDEQKRAMVQRIVLNDPQLSMVTAWHPEILWGCAFFMARLRKLRSHYHDHYPHRP